MGEKRLDRHWPKRTIWKLDLDNSHQHFLHDRAVKIPIILQKLNLFRKDTERACNLLVGKMIKTHDEIEQLINAFQSKKDLLTSDELDGLHIPIRVGFSKILDKKQNCSESRQNFESSSNLDFGNSTCESAIFGKKKGAFVQFKISDERFYGKYVEIDLIKSVYRKDKRTLTTLRLNWHNYLTGTKLVV